MFGIIELHTVLEPKTGVSDFIQTRSLYFRFFSKCVNKKRPITYDKIHTPIEVAQIITNKSNSIRKSRATATGPKNEKNQVPLNQDASVNAPNLRV